jgi:hypothetical protein
VKKIKRNSIFIGQTPLKNKIWFYLTCIRPVTKFELCSLQVQLVTILEGFRESDMQHYQTEKLLVDEMKKVAELTIDKVKNKQTDGKDDVMIN